MGTDIYLYKCLSRHGKKAVILYKSAQDSGLGPTDMKQKWTAAFWVSVVLEHECGAWDRQTGAAACALARHNAWKVKTGELVVQGIPEMEMEEYEALMNRFGKTSSLGLSSYRGNSVGFQTVAAAEMCKAALNGKTVKNAKGEEGTVTIEFENLTEGKPDWISHYDFDHKIFGQFLADVKQLSVDYHLDYENHGYWETCATYELTFTDEKWCEHLEPGTEWPGR